MQFRLYPVVITYHVTRLSGFHPTKIMLYLPKLKSYREVGKEGNKLNLISEGLMHSMCEGSVRLTTGQLLPVQQLYNALHQNDS